MLSDRYISVSAEQAAACVCLDQSALCPGKFIASFVGLMNTVVVYLPSCLSVHLSVCAVVAVVVIGCCATTTTLGL